MILTTLLTLIYCCKDDKKASYAVNPNETIIIDDDDKEDDKPSGGVDTPTGGGTNDDDVIFPGNPEDECDPDLEDCDPIGKPDDDNDDDDNPGQSDDNDPKPEKDKETGESMPDYPNQRLELCDIWEDELNKYQKFLPPDGNEKIYEIHTLSKEGKTRTVDHYDHDDHWSTYYEDGSIIYKFFKTSKDTHNLMIYERYDRDAQGELFNVKWFYSGKVLMSVEKYEPDYYSAVVRENGVIQYSEPEAAEDEIVDILLNTKP